MEKYLRLKNCPLFTGISESELHTLLRCLSAAEKHYEKNRYVFMEDEAAASFGVVLTGSVHIVREDFWGVRTILARVGPGGLFGEAFSWAGTEKLPVSVLAAEASGVLLLDNRKIAVSCPSACGFHTRLVQNMLRVIAQKNVMLTRKMEFVTQRTIRGKLLAYLSARAKEAGSNTFDIPFNRQELAEYLSADRSAMSRELCRMRDDGLLRFQRNHFNLLGTEEHSAGPKRPPDRIPNI